VADPRLALPGGVWYKCCMRIAIDVTPGVMGHAGIGRYALELARGLCARRPDVEIRPFSTDPGRRRENGLLGRTAWIERPISPRQLRLEVALGYALGGNRDSWFAGCDLFHATDHILPPLRRVASVFTLHDLTCFQAGATHTVTHREYSRHMLKRFVSRADLVIAVSESTRRDALARFDLDPARIRTIHHATPEGFAPASPMACRAARERYRLPERYLLSVGTLEPRKNHAVLFRALAGTPRDVRLVVVGRRGWKAGGILAALAASGTAERVVFTGFVPDTDLAALYTGACGFLFPTLYEGFGFPVLEALACGTPVAASNTSSLPEVLGDAGLLLPPGDVAAWREAMLEFWSADPATWRLRATGFARAARFTWDEVVTSTAQVYAEAHARRA